MNEAVIRYGTAGIPEPERDYSTAFRRAHPALAGMRNFLFFGRVHPKKGPDLLIRAVGRMAREGRWKRDSMRLVMAGPADDDYADELKKLVLKEGIEDVVYWTGMLTGDEKWGAFQAAEVFVLPSHQENFGIAVAESLSAGTPVLIAHPVNISPEIAADRAGLADDDTVEGTERMLRQWLQLGEADRVEMKRQARLTFEARYTAEVGAKDMLRNIYLVLAARRIRRQRRDQV